jgi:hypothetical protein
MSTPTHCRGTCPQLAVIQLTVRYQVDNTSPPYISLSRKTRVTEQLLANRMRPRAQTFFLLMTPWCLHQTSHEYDVVYDRWQGFRGCRMCSLPFANLTQLLSLHHCFCKQDVFKCGNKREVLIWCNSTCGPSIKDYVQRILCSCLWTAATNGPFFHRTDDICVRSPGGMILTVVNWTTRRKTCPSATLSTANPIWTVPGTNPGLRGKRQVSAMPRLGCILVKFYTFKCQYNKYINRRASTLWKYCITQNRRTAQTCTPLQFIYCSTGLSHILHADSLTFMFFLL